MPSSPYTAITLTASLRGGNAGDGQEEGEGGSRCSPIATDHREVGTDRLGANTCTCETVERGLNTTSLSTTASYFATKAHGAVAAARRRRSSPGAGGGAQRQDSVAMGSSGEGFVSLLHPTPSSPFACCLPPDAEDKRPPVEVSDATTADGTAASTCIRSGWRVWSPPPQLPPPPQAATTATAQPPLFYSNTGNSHTYSHYPTAASATGTSALFAGGGGGAVLRPSDGSSPLRGQQHHDEHQRQHRNSSDAAMLRQKERRRRFSLQQQHQEGAAGRGGGESDPSSRRVSSSLGLPSAAVGVGGGVVWRAPTSPHQLPLFMAVPITGTGGGGGIGGTHARHVSPGTSHPTTTSTVTTATTIASSKAIPAFADTVVSGHTTTISRGNTPAPAAPTAGWGRRTTSTTVTTSPSVTPLGGGGSSGGIVFSSSLGLTGDERVAMAERMRRDAQQQQGGGGEGPLSLGMDGSYSQLLAPTASAGDDGDGGVFFAPFLHFDNNTQQQKPSVAAAVVNDRPRLGVRRKTPTSLASASFDAGVVDAGVGGNSGVALPPMAHNAQRQAQLNGMNSSGGCDFPHRRGSVPSTTFGASSRGGDPTTALLLSAGSRGGGGGNGGNWMGSSSLSANCRARQQSKENPLSMVDYMNCGEGAAVIPPPPVAAAAFPPRRVSLSSTSALVAPLPQQGPAARGSNASPLATISCDTVPSPSLSVCQPPATIDDDHHRRCGAVVAPEAAVAHVGVTTSAPDRVARLTPQSVILSPPSAAVGCVGGGGGHGGAAGGSARAAVLAISSTLSLNLNATAAFRSASGGGGDNAYGCGGGNTSHPSHSSPSQSRRPSAAMSCSSTSFTAAGTTPPMAYPLGAAHNHNHNHGNGYAAASPESRRRSAALRYSMSMARDVDDAVDEEVGAAPQEGTGLGPATGGEQEAMDEEPCAAAAAPLSFLTVEGGHPFSGDDVDRTIGAMLVDLVPSTHANEEGGHLHYEQAQSLPPPSTAMQQTMSDCSTTAIHRSAVVVAAGAGVSVSGGEVTMTPTTAIAATSDQITPLQGTDSSGGGGGPCEALTPGAHSSAHGGGSTGRRLPVILPPPPPLAGLGGDVAAVIPLFHHHHHADRHAESDGAAHYHQLQQQQNHRVIIMEGLASSLSAANKTASSSVLQLSSHQQYQKYYQHNHHRQPTSYSAVGPSESVSYAASPPPPHHNPDDYGDHQHSHVVVVSAEDRERLKRYSLVMPDERDSLFSRRMQWHGGGNDVDAIATDDNHNGAVPVSVVAGVTANEEEAAHSPRGVSCYSGSSVGRNGDASSSNPFAAKTVESMATSPILQCTRRSYDTVLGEGAPSSPSVYSPISSQQRGGGGGGPLPPRSLSPTGFGSSMISGARGGGVGGGAGAGPLLPRSPHGSHQNHPNHLSSQQQQQDRHQWGSLLQSQQSQPYQHQMPPLFGGMGSGVGSSSIGTQQLSIGANSSVQPGGLSPSLAMLGGGGGGGSSNVTSPNNMTASSAVSARRGPQPNTIQSSSSGSEYVLMQGTANSLASPHQPHHQQQHQSHQYAIPSSRYQVVDPTHFLARLSPSAAAAAIVRDPTLTAALVAKHEQQLRQQQQSGASQRVSSNSPSQSSTVGRRGSNGNSSGGVLGVGGGGVGGGVLSSIASPVAAHGGQHFVSNLQQLLLGGGGGSGSGGGSAVVYRRGGERSDSPPLGTEAATHGAGGGGGGNVRPTASLLTRGGNIGLIGEGACNASCSDDAMALVASVGTDSTAVVTAASSSHYAAACLPPAHNTSAGGSRRRERGADSGSGGGGGLLPPSPWIRHNCHSHGGGTASTSLTDPNLLMAPNTHHNQFHGGAPLHLGSGCSSVGQQSPMTAITTTMSNATASHSFALSEYHHNTHNHLNLKNNGPAAGGIASVGCAVQPLCGCEDRARTPTTTMMGGAAVGTVGTGRSTISGGSGAPLVPSPTGSPRRRLVVMLSQLPDEAGGTATLSHDANADCDRVNPHHPLPTFPNTLLPSTRAAHGTASNAAAAPMATTNAEALRGLLSIAGVGTAHSGGDCGAPHPLPSFATTTDPRLKGVALRAGDVAPPSSPSSRFGGGAGLSAGGGSSGAFPHPSSYALSIASSPSHSPSSHPQKNKNNNNSIGPAIATGNSSSVQYPSWSLGRRVSAAVGGVGAGGDRTLPMIETEGDRGDGDDDDTDSKSCSDILQDADGSMLLLLGNSLDGKAEEKPTASSPSPAAAVIPPPAAVAADVTAGPIIAGGGLGLVAGGGGSALGGASGGTVSRRRMSSVVVVHSPPSANNVLDTAAVPPPLLPLGGALFSDEEDDEASTKRKGSSSFLDRAPTVVIPLLPHSSSSISSVTAARRGSVGGTMAAVSSSSASTATAAGTKSINTNTASVSGTRAPRTNVMRGGGGAAGGTTTASESTSNNTLSTNSNTTISSGTMAPTQGGRGPHYPHHCGGLLGNRDSGDEFPLGIKHSKSVHSLRRQQQLQKGGHHRPHHHGEEASPHAHHHNQPSCPTSPSHHQHQHSLLLDRSDADGGNRHHSDWGRANHHDDERPLHRLLPTVVRGGGGGGRGGGGGGGAATLSVSSHGSPLGSTGGEGEASFGNLLSSVGTNSNSERVRTGGGAVVVGSEAPSPATAACRGNDENGVVVIESPL